MELMSGAVPPAIGPALASGVLAAAAGGVLTEAAGRREHDERDERDAADRPWRHRGEASGRGGRRAAVVSSTAGARLGAAPAGVPHR